MLMNFGSENLYFKRTQNPEFQISLQFSFTSKKAYPKRYLILKSVYFKNKQIHFQMI